MTTPPRNATADIDRLRIDRDRPRRSSRRRNVAILATLLILVVAAVAARMRSGLFPGGTIDVETSVALRPATAGGAGAGGVLTANGYVQARRSAAVSSEITGRLMRLHVEAGSRVERGDLLAELSSENLRAQVAQAEAEVAVRNAAIVEAQAERNDAENELGRQIELKARGLGTQSAVDAAQARRDLVAARIELTGQQVVAAQATLRLARAELDKTRIRAPFTGTVLRKNAEIGEMVAPVSMGGSGSRGAIVTIAALDSLDVEVDVNEAYIGRVRLGQPAEAVTDAYPDTAFVARVRQIVPTSDRQKATVLVKVEIMRPDARLLPEMGAKVTFLDETTPAQTTKRRVTVLEATVQRDGDATFVWLVGTDGRVTRRTVQVGNTTNGRVEIASGLEGGETLVSKAARPLRGGAKVRTPA